MALLIGGVLLAALCGFDALSWLVAARPRVRRGHGRRGGARRTRVPCHGSDSAVVLVAHAEATVVFQGTVACLWLELHAAEHDAARGEAELELLVAEDVLLHLQQVSFEVQLETQVDPLGDADVGAAYQ